MEAISSGTGQRRQAQRQRGINTVEKILEAAERLIGLLGVEGPTMRQIALAAGQANNNAVQHYFGTREELLLAIIERRRSQMMPRRTALLERAGATPDFRTIIDVIYLPLAELMEQDHACRYAQFQLQLALSNRMNLLEPTDNSAADLGVEKLRDDLMGYLPKALPRALRYPRIETASAMVLAALSSRSATREQGQKMVSFSAFISPLLNAVAAAIQAPP